MSIDEGVDADEGSDPYDRGLGLDANASPPVEHRFAMARGGAIILEESSFRIIETRGLSRSSRLSYSALTHVVVTDRMLLIGTTRGIYTLRRSEFKGSADIPHEVRRSLLEAVGQLPDGALQLARMADLQRLGETRRPDWAIWATAVLCVLGMFVQWADPMIELTGAFIPELFERGEFWRAITAHFLHGAPGFPIHLTLNIVGLVALGHLVERPLGPWRTGVVLAMGAVGTIIGSTVADYDEVIGASGLVAALAGAILALELHYPEDVPVFWRLPRRLFIGALLIQVVVDQLLSNILAGGAHLGGFAAGYLTARLIAGAGPGLVEPSPRIRLAAMLAAVMFTMGIVGAVPLARHDAGALENHAQRLLSTPAEFHLVRMENATAWFLATEGKASPDGLGLAVALADRAATNTARMEPNILDTLAEALFQNGDRLAAILTIEEAIRLVPMEPYFQEQRRRFTGERAADDRPDPPGGAPEVAPFESLDPRPDSVPFDPEAPAVMI